MTISISQSIAIIAVVALGTFLTRAFPFLLFGKGTPPKAVLFIGEHLPSAVIAILVIYCIGSSGNINIISITPKLIAGVIVALLHIWKRNNLLSIGLGTVIYMILVQFVFV